MVRNIKFIWYGMSYKEMKGILKDNRTLSSFPLVESPTTMILLGSIHRQHLIKVHLFIKKQTIVQLAKLQKVFLNSASKSISVENDGFKPLQCGIDKRLLEVFDIFLNIIYVILASLKVTASEYLEWFGLLAQEEEERLKLLEMRARRPSRFEVVPVPSIICSKAESNDNIRSTDQLHLPFRDRADTVCFSKEALITFILFGC